MSLYRVVVRHANGVTDRTWPTVDEATALATAAIWRRYVGGRHGGTVELEGRGPDGDWQTIG